jgi:ABC-2 type transport system ATP-binding protein
VIISVENLSHKYGDRTALTGVSFSIEEGELYGLLGPNGSGKSTLFRILSTLMAPASGQARIAGFDIHSQAAEVRRKIGVVFQSYSQDKSLTVWENLEAQGYLFGLSGAFLKRRAGEALERLGLADRRNDVAKTLSGGMRRRVEIAKALLHQPAVLLMDEPSTGLDPVARHELWRFLNDLRQETGVTILVATHLLEEADLCDRILLLHEGRVVAAGTPAELKAEVGADVVVLETRDPVDLRRLVQERFGLEATEAGGTLRVEVQAGHRFAAEAVEAFPGAIVSVAFHKPTLADIFFDRTGANL